VPARADGADLLTGDQVTEGATIAIGAGGVLVIRH
jgi:hypothetical protein